MALFPALQLQVRPWDDSAAGQAAAHQVKIPTGCAVLTSAGQLAVRHVVHAVGPIYTVPADSAPLLASAYRSALALANEHKAASIAFPAVSCGLHGYPPTEAAEVGARGCMQQLYPAVRLQPWLLQVSHTSDCRRKARQSLELPRTALLALPPHWPLQIALRTCAAEAGRLQSIHFYLMGEEEAAAWLEHATALFQPLPMLQVVGDAGAAW